jgi:hypothetical protein
MKLIPKVPLKNILGHSNAFRYSSHSVDQVERLIIQNEAELNIETIFLLICCCFYKKCNFLRRSLDDNCCGRICIRKKVINQREVRSSDENVTDRFLNQETRSHSLRSLPASTSLEMTELNPVPMGSTHRCVRLINVDGRTMFYVFVVWTIYVLGNISTCFCKCFQLREGGVAKACPTPVVLGC